ncbi:MAG: glycoside hydrolase family 13 protein [Bacteroidia bacterium]|jgi:glycosidase|nr:glycoside hydrolase family 13 protein [Bacteroidia bacterium]
MKVKWFFRLSLLLGFFSIQHPTGIFAQEVSRIEPPFWWTGMAESELQLLVYGKDIGKTRVSLSYPGVELKEVVMVENPNYLFINLNIGSQASPGIMQLVFQGSRKRPLVISYELKARTEGSAQRGGFDNADVIYLLMPDRFANGNPANDNMPGMLEKANRGNPDGRHGGDLAGIVSHFDYLKKLGVTTLWLNPVLENNMPAYSYHGYAITDFYKVDPRFGTNEDYADLIRKAQDKGLKIVKDVVFNHFGTNHWWMNDLPSADWINQWPEFTRSNYRGGTLTDPYASESDKKLMLRGWFDRTMADFNQDNPFVSNYLIQNSIWWVEYAGLDGIRVDTYPYSGKSFMRRWKQRINKEYPNFSVVGEVWLNTTPQVAYWMGNAANADGFNSELKHLFDFPLKYAIRDAFNESNGWSSGVSRLYESLSLDFLYANPMNIVVFADNHDADRIFTALRDDIRKFRMAMAFLLTVRGIPQIYYGTEIAMTGWEHSGHGFIREDFPGGWDGDESSVKDRKSLKENQREALEFMQMLLNWRKNKKVIHNGKTTHYVPENGVYVYFRHDDNESVMVVINNNEESRTFTTERFAENLTGYQTGTDVLHRTYFDQLRTISIPAMSARIIELKR